MQLIWGDSPHFHLRACWGGGASSQNAGSPPQTITRELMAASHNLKPHLHQAEKTFFCSWGQEVFALSQQVFSQAYCPISPELSESFETQNLGISSSYNFLLYYQAFLQRGNKYKMTD